MRERKDLQEPEVVAEEHELALRDRPGPFALDPSVKLFGFLATLCYLMGFLIVNSSLVGLGVSDLSTLSPRLVFIGAIGLALAATSFVLPFMAAWIFQSTDSIAVKVVAIGIAFLGLAFPIGVYVPLLHWSDNAFVGTQGRSWAIAVLLSLALALCSLVAACGAFRVWLHLVRPETGDMPKGTKWLGKTLKPKEGATQAPSWMGAGAWALPVIAALFGLIVLFGHYIYPTLPTQVGGGRPKHVHLVVETKDISALKALRLCPSKSGTRNCSAVSADVGILFESDQSYLVRRLPDGALALIQKDLVQAIRVK